MATLAPGLKLRSQAPAFDLPGVDGKSYSLDNVRGPNGVVVMFICNHCPYVKAVVDKIVRDMTDLKGQGIGSIAISSNDGKVYPEDSFDNMKKFAAQHRFGFPYVFDESQDVARAYDAVCTPEFYGFDRDLKLAYHGRLDASGRSSDPNARRELYDAMVAVAQGRAVPSDQQPAVGCSIKWKTDD